MSSPVPPTPPTVRRIIDVDGTPLHVTNEGQVLDDDALAAPVPATLSLPDAHPFSDGRLFDPAVVEREVLFHCESMVVSAFEIGKRLCWAKDQLGHGQFGAWSERFPFSDRTGQRYMQVARRLQAHPQLLGPLSRASLKSALLLGTLDDSELQEIVEDGALGEVPLAELGDKSHHELRDLLAREGRARTRAEDEAQAERRRAEKAEREVTRHREDMARRRGAMSLDIEEEFRGHLADYRRRLDGDLALVGLGVDGIVSRWDELSPELRADAAGLLAYLRARAEQELLRFEAMTGGFVAGGEWRSLLEEVRPAGAAYPLPEGRTPLHFDDGEQG